MESDNSKSFLGVPARTLSLVILLGFIAAGLLIIALKDINKKPAVSPSVTTNSINTTSPQTILSIAQNPVAVSTPSGSFFYLDILIDTGANKVNSVQLELSFDPNILQNVDIAPGQFMTSPAVLIKNIDTVNGRISYVLTPANQTTVSGKGIIATLSFSLNRSQKTATQTAIAFVPKTEVDASGASQSVLKSSVNNTITLVPTLSIINERTGTKSAK